MTDTEPRDEIPVYDTRSWKDRAWVRYFGLLIVPVIAVVVWGATTQWWGLSSNAGFCHDASAINSIQQVKTLPELQHGLDLMRQAAQDTPNQKVRSDINLIVAYVDDKLNGTDGPPLAQAQAAAERVQSFTDDHC